MIVALAFSFFTTPLSSELSVDTWEGMAGAAGETLLSWTGEVSALTSNALFLFLVFRWLWRFLIWRAVAGWLVLVSVIFLGPLLFFVRPLYIAREAARLQYGRLAHTHHLAFHRKWISGSDHEDDILGSADPSSVSDLNASVETALGMLTVPLDRNALLLLLGSAAAPLLLVAALQMPVGDLSRLIFGVLF